MAKQPQCGCGSTDRVSMYKGRLTCHGCYEKDYAKDERKLTGTQEEEDRDRRIEYERSVR